MRPEDLGISRLFERIRDAVIVADTKTQRIVFWNPAATNIFGYAASEALKLCVEALVPEHLKDQYRAGIARYAETGRGPYVDSRKLLELPAVRKDGQEIWIELSLSPIELVDADDHFLLAIVRDATERRQTREALENSEAKFRPVVESMGEGLLFTDANDVVLYMNRRMVELTGYTPEEMIGRPAYELLLPPEQWSDMLEHNRRRMRGVSERYEMRLKRKDGRMFWTEISAAPYRNVAGEVVGTLEAITDITERKQAEDALRQSEELYRAVVEQAAESILLVDAETKGILEANTAFHHSLGYTAEELQRMTLYDIVAHDPESIDRNIERALEEGNFCAGEQLYRHKDGSLADVEASGSYISHNNGDALCIIAHDIAERKRAEEALRVSQADLAEAQRIAHLGSWEHDAEKDTVHWSDEMYRIFGFSPQQFVPTFEVFLDSIHPDDREAVREYAANLPREGQQDSVIEHRIVRPDGEVRFVQTQRRVERDETGKLIRVTGMVQDVTDHKRVQESFHRSLNVLLALREAGQILGSTLESEEIVSRLLEIIQRVSNLTATVISVQDEEGRVRIWRSVGLEGLWRRARYAPGAEDARRVALETQEHRLFLLQHPDSRARRLVGLCLPLRTRDRILGVLEAYGSESLADDDTVAMLSGLAGQAASALENAQLYGELGERERKLHELVGKLLGAQEEERHRVAYEVHDRLAQKAVTAHQHLQAFARRYPLEAEESRRDLERILRLVRETVSEARSIIADLRPTILDDLGLAAAIYSEVERLREDGYRVDYEEELGDERLPTAVEIALFRVVQEALTNVRKHAQTQQVRIELRRRGDKIYLEVRDYGRGFDLAAASDGGGRGERVGLAGMRERVSVLDGEFEIYSRPGAGTGIIVVLPLPTVAEEASYGH